MEKLNKSIKLENLLHHLTIFLLFFFFITSSQRSFAATRNTIQTQHVLSGDVPNGLTTDEWGTIERAIADVDYHFAWHSADNAHPNGYYWAPNRIHGWQTVFSERGVRVLPYEGGNWSWGLSLSGYGDENGMKWLDVRPNFVAKDDRLTYRWDENLTEWWVNSSAGLEQGFTIQQRPNGAQSDGFLQLEMVIGGDLFPVMQGEAVLFQDRQGETVLTYDKLYVTDAHNRVLPAYLELSRSRNVIRIIVDDGDALYPLTVDPWVEAAKLTASDAAVSDQFGKAVAISGNTVVVGAMNGDGAVADSGAAYVFVRPSGGWTTATETAKLTASDGAAGDAFGFEVAISGDTIVVGAMWDDDVADRSGTAYVFVKPSTGWVTTTETAKLTGSDVHLNSYFGHDVGIAGDTIIVGAPEEHNSGNGVVYVYVRPSTGWVTTTETAKLTASDGATNDLMAYSVDVSGDTIVAGARLDDDVFNRSGSAYVFVRPSGGWVSATETAKFHANVLGDNHQFGYSVGIHEDTIVVGEQFGDGAAVTSGAAYVFVRPNGGWVSGSETAKLTASDGATGDQFGHGVDVDDVTIVVGARRDDDNGSDSGSAYIYVRPNSGWSNTTETVKVTASDGAALDGFGDDVSVNGDTIVIGARFDDSNAGSAYIVANSFCSRQSGDWGSASTWVGGVVPGSGDDACISTGDTVTLAADAAANRVLISPKAAFDVATHNLTVEDIVYNNGTISQTQIVNNANVELLHIQNLAATSTAYRGVVVDASTNSQNLGTVNVSVRETVDWFSWFDSNGVNRTQYCTYTGNSSPRYAERCFIISPANQPTMDVTVRLWGLNNELSGIAEADLAAYHYAGGSWNELTNRASGNDGGSYSYGEGDTSSFSHFLLAEASVVPTAIIFQSAAANATDFTSFPIISVLLALLGVTFIALKRERPFKRGWFAKNG